MHPELPISRRTTVKSALFGVLAVSLPNLSFARDIRVQPDPQKLFHRYPSIDDAIVADIVGASHFDFEKVKSLVEKRPELARATWDWSFGDWETAIGAASHVGRRDIVHLLIQHGARPDIFTFAMLGEYDAVKAMIDAVPGVQSIAGPHGISLLQHAKNGLRSNDLTAEQGARNERLIAYLESLGDADPRPNSMELDPDDKEKYLGDYMYGDGPTDGFSVRLNMRDMISLGKLGKFGGALFQVSENNFIYNGTTSVKIQFAFDGDKVTSLTVHEPDLVLTAKKV